MIASDNVRDGFYPYGDYDLIDIFRLAVVAGHLGPDDWLDATTDIPARWIGRARDLAEGASADFIRCDASDLVRRHLPHAHKTRGVARRCHPARSPRSAPMTTKHDLEAFKADLDGIRVHDDEKYRTLRSKDYYRYRPDPQRVARRQAGRHNRRARDGRRSHARGITGSRGTRCR